mmetsp:Transcript_27786/g.93407  ORF Transcript_27786/g.93407 Transcript_27786/m.93407 type:complete len:204 (+) Transcript_27786:325-936(+)
MRQTISTPSAARASAATRPRDPKPGRTARCAARCCGARRRRSKDGWRSSSSSRNSPPPPKARSAALRPTAKHRVCCLRFTSSRNPAHPGRSSTGTATTPSSWPLSAVRKRTTATRLSRRGRRWTTSAKQTARCKSVRSTAATARFWPSAATSSCSTAPCGTGRFATRRLRRAGFTTRSFRRMPSSGRDCRCGWPYPASLRHRH